MKVGIAGFAGSGKSTVFQWLSGVKPDAAKAQHGQVGIAKMPDERLTWLSDKFKPKKTTHATLELLDTPGLFVSERRDNPRRLAILRDAGGLLIVLNGFSGDDLAGELLKFREELLFADLEIITNRIQKIEDQLKKPRPAKEKEAYQVELDILRRIAHALESGQSPAQLGLKDDEEKAIRSFQLLTLKPELVLVSSSEDRVAQPLPEALLKLAPTALQTAARFDLELQDLPEAERAAFIQDFMPAGAPHMLTRDEVLTNIYGAMGQMVFFTVGEDECRAWPLPRKSTAVEGAGCIHTDLANGFVRAEVVGYPDFRRVGSMKEAKQHGVYRLESKTYIVQDGDIMHILSST